MSDHAAKRRKTNFSSENAGKSLNSHDNSKSQGPGAATMNKRHGEKNDQSAELASASGFYKSSLFKLQLDELLAESRPNYDKQVSRIQETLRKVKDIFERLPEISPKPAFDAEKDLRRVHDIVVPYPEPRPGKDTKYTVAYARPSNVNVVGSFALRTGVKPDAIYTVDLAVTMPSSLFQEKDYVNHRFFHKRAYYISCLAAGIRETQDADMDVKFELQDGDSLRPILVLQPADTMEKGHMRTQIRVITAIEDGTFPVTRTLPLKNNIRQNSTEDGDREQSTPFYNGALRAESTVASYHKSHYAAIRNCESFKDACALGRIWLQQRGFGPSFQTGGFGGFEWTTLMAILLEGGGPNGKPVLLKSYSSYQLFKATVQFLAGMDLMKPLLLHSSDIQFPSDTPVLYDGKRGQNILYKMTSWSYGFLRHEAKNTVQMLNESRDDNFESVFILKVNEPMLRFDRLMVLPTSDQFNILRTVRNWNAIYQVLSRALGDRVEQIYLHGRCTSSWRVNAKPSRKDMDKAFSVALLLNPENATRAVDHGPAAEQKAEAESFQAFWGQKAELRRFKDGSIRESLVWSEDQTAPSIVHQILLYILPQHFDFVEHDIHYIGDEYDDELYKNGDGILSYSNPSFQLINDAFQSLEKKLQTMDEVPLTIRHVAPASSHLRYTALHVRKTRQPVDIVLQFESSGRWPDDLVAIQMTKLAFLIKIGDSMKQAGIASCNVGIENESSRYLNTGFLDVDVSGVTFRLRIYHEREQVLLERQLKEKSETVQGKQEITYALSMYKRTFIQLPRLTLAIRTLCTRFPCLSPTIRLVKHWFASHLFTGHVSEELIELLVVRSFTQPYPWEPPSTIMLGFLRTLHFLSRWDWRQDPLMVDLGGELDQDTIGKIRTRFSAWRSVDPGMNSVVLFAASDVDVDGITWTQYETPSKVVAARMSTLAKAAIKLLREEGGALDVSKLFSTSLAPYDFTIDLRPIKSGDSLKLSGKYKNIDEQNSRDLTAKHNAVKSFVRDLQSSFGSNILFFHGDENCDVIAGIWNPTTIVPKAWNLKMAYSTVPKADEEDGRVAINREAILNEISRVGADMVSRITVKG
ncbi:rRNA-processing protein UTP22 [Aspergillus candidus]|uniref:U3 small nucleolar RNA-associated protein 22 n=1 Tax=Aspergillus candidus TaxID=41067 RepID=A0A2I2FFI9_ASPCN|nr:pre-rRNA processing protein Utp22 [Aspergillus candidus]PLB39385.1 pre-rRNA processing protein Utp22 [Aspergillus candidus]